MIDLALPLKIAGWGLLLLALIHAAFPRRFNWSAELAALSPMNRQMMQVHTLFVALMVGLMGTLCAFGSAALLAPTSLGRWVSIGFAIFWSVRGYCQWFVYSPELWRGKRFETGMHVLFSLVWTLLTALFGLLAWRQFSMN